jgi:hypothetical protein
MTSADLPTRISHRKIATLLGAFALLLLCATSRLQSADNESDKFAVVSPDGKFIFRQTIQWESEDGDAAFGVVDSRTGRAVLKDPSANLPPMEDSIACLWAPDSKRFAVSARVAGRNETTELFEWTGKQFEHVPSIENTIAALLALDRKAQLKKAGIPASTVLRHVWDSYRALKWEDDDRLTVLGSSTRSYDSRAGPEGTARIVSSITFTLKLRTKRCPQIIAQNTQGSAVSKR